MNFLDKSQILVDKDDQSGFESIAEAREYLLRIGRRQEEDNIKGGSRCHIVAPVSQLRPRFKAILTMKQCPHDGICPLYRNYAKATKCTFSQRMQRPAFVRRTKDVNAGHEDVGYSYIILRRGTRPEASLQTSSTLSTGKF